MTAYLQCVRYWAKLNAVDTMMNNRVLLRGNSLSGRDTDEETDHYRQLQGSVGSTLEVFPTQLEGQGGFSKWICELRLGR